MDYTIETVATLSGLRELTDFVYPILEIDPQSAYIAENYPPERLLAEIERGDRTAFLIRDDLGIVAAGECSALSEREKIDRGIADPRRMVLSDYNVVANRRRGERLASGLKRFQYQWAESVGAAIVVGELPLSNFPSQRMIFREGFIATRVLPASLGIPEPFFVVIRPVKLHATATGWHEQTTIRASRVETIRSMLDGGWVAYGVTPTVDRGSKQPEDWTFCLGR